ncbi:MAG: hypothetical protein OER89_15730, partial [Gemmatimonadota bacterium]|nr:hypothetical protein [Gemmatimonadota bacterium]
MDLAELATPEVAERLIFTLQETGSARRTVTNMPVVGEPAADGSMEINDCLLLQPPVTAVQANWYSGVADVGDDGLLRLTALEPESLTGCVPAAIADAVLVDYEDYWDAAVEYWVPADADHPRLAETATGAHYDLIFELLVDHEARGLELRGRPETHPEVFEYRSPTEVVIVDCQLTDPERGLFVTATGERLPDVAPIVPGQRDARQVTLLLEDGRWKVSDRQAQVDFECQFAPS